MSPLPRFAALAGGLAAGFLAVGVLATRDGAAGGSEAMFWAWGVVLLGSLAGAVPLVLASPETGRGRAASVGPAAVSSFLAAILLRMGAVGVGAAAVIFLVDIEAKPFLLWLAVGYLLFLILETAFALRLFRSL
jgi:hypothetical protein